MTFRISKNLRFQREKLALFTSIIFNPMIISLGAFGILIFDRPHISENANAIFFSCFLFSNLIPVLTVLILKKTGRISDLDASRKEQRFMPLFLGIVYSGIGFLVLNSLDAGNLTQGLMFCYMINTIIIMTITRHWKISIHAAGVAAPIVALWVHGAHFPILMSGVMILVGWSRVILKAHSVSQVFAGHLLGLLLTWIQLHLFFL